MSAEEHPRTPGDVARELVRRTLYDPVAVAILAAHKVKPLDVEATVTELLSYLEAPVDG